MQTRDRDATALAAVDWTVPEALATRFRCEYEAYVRLLHETFELLERDQRQILGDTEVDLAATAAHDERVAEELDARQGEIAATAAGGRDEA